MKLHTKILLTIILGILSMLIGVITSLFEQGVHTYEFLKEEVWSR